VPYVKVLPKPEADGTNMVGKVYIPNPTVMTIQMVSIETTPLDSKLNKRQGDVLMDLFANNTNIGNSTISNLILVPGNNTLDMTFVLCDPYNSA